LFSILPLSFIWNQHIFRYKSVRNVFVGKGFLLAYQALRSSMLKEIGEITKSNPSLPVVVVGHSLGAAMAELCAVDLTETLNLTNVHVWNYGDPRVGNLDWMYYYKTKVATTWRTTNQKDPVPHLPPLFLEFFHVPIEVWFPKDDKTYQICDGSGEDPDCSDSLYIDDSITDHLTYLGFDERWGHPYNCGKNL